jgi:elongation factor G
MRAVLALGVSASVFSYVAAQNPVHGVVQWQIEKRIIPPAPGQPLHKRAQTYEEVITNERTRGGYFTTCALGTPWQNISLQLDTGSSDIWVPDQTASACSVSRQNPAGCDLGTFNPNSSSSYQDVGRGEFNIQYVDGSHATGDYFTDRFEIGGARVQNVTMGLGIDTDIAYGLVGVGYALNEAIVGGTQSAASAYPNLPVVMQDEGLINSVAYSLWLNDLGKQSSDRL